MKTTMKMVVSIALLGLVLAGCAAKPARSTVPVEEVQGPPVLTLWSVCPSPCFDLSARFVAYPAGAVIFRHKHHFSEVPQYIGAELSGEQYERFLGPDRLEVLSDLDETYYVSDGTHAPNHILQWRTRTVEYAKSKSMASWMIAIRC